MGKNIRFSHNLDRIIAILEIKGEPVFDEIKARLHFFKAQEFQLSGYWDQALLEYQRAFELYPQEADYLAGIGYVYAKKRLTDRAMDVVQQALEMDPEHSTALYAYGIILGEQKKFNQAVLILQKVITIDQNFAQAYYALAVDYYFLKQYPQAMEMTKYAMALGLSVRKEFLLELEKELNSMD